MKRFRANIGGTISGLGVLSALLGLFSMALSAPFIVLLDLDPESYARITMGGFILVGFGMYWIGQLLGGEPFF